LGEKEKPTQLLTVGPSLDCLFVEEICVICVPPWQAVV
jgi:hypothetical protein